MRVGCWQGVRRMGVLSWMELDSTAFWMGWSRGSWPCDSHLARMAPMLLRSARWRRRLQTCFCARKADAS